MSSDLSIKVESLSKCYETYSKPHDRLKQSIYPRLQRLAGMPARQYFREFWALRNVSFEVSRGETVGIIGRNGSGKSTLLQMICGTLNPTSGNVQTVGRVAALLELGSGFNPEFTGHENIRLNAMLLGLSQQEIDACYDDIVAFADIGDFIDQPVKTYSSGMAIRLAFAVQAQIQPDILIVDEALSVGDAKFQAKCFERLRQLKENGTSILLVTHASEQIVTHCSRAILLNQGEQLLTGEPRTVINHYLDLLFGKEKKPLLQPATDSNVDQAPPQPNAYQLSTDADLFATHIGYNPYEYRWGDGTVAILDYFLGTPDQAYPHAIAPGQHVNLAVSVQFLATVVRPILGVTIKTKEGVTVYGTNTELLDSIEFQNMGQLHTNAFVEFEFDCRLAGGDYFVSLGIATRQGDDIVPLDRRYDCIHLRVLADTSNNYFGLADIGLRISTIRRAP